MKGFFFLFITCVAHTYLWSQSNTGNSVQTNSTTNTPVLDSVTLLREEKSSTPAAFSNSEKKRKTLEYKTLEMTAPAMEDSQSTNTQSTYFMQQQFQNSNTSATRSVYRRSATPWEQKKMDESVQYYQTMLPNSFEAHFYSYLAGHFNPQLFPELQQAAILQPTNTEVRKNVAAHYIVTQQNAKADSVITKMIGDSTIVPGQLDYSSNLLASCVQNSTLVLHGFDDFLPVYHLNQSQPDKNITLVSLDLLQSTVYRNSLTDKGYRLPQQKSVDTAYLQSFCTLNTDKNIQLSMTLPKEYLQAFTPDLFPLGLTFGIQRELAETYTWNNHLWTESWNQAAIQNGFNDASDRWSGNYLPVLLSLKKQYEITDRKEEAEKLNTVIRQIAVRTKQTSAVKKYTD